MSDTDRPWLYFLNSASSWLRRVAEQREAEERGRQEWIADVKRRLGLICADEETAIIGDFLNGGVFYEVTRGADGTPVAIRHLPREQIEWPAGVAGRYRVISDHTAELPRGWPPECRCVLLDGEQVSLGGPCPGHAA